jgi:hypothetical protein
VATRRSQRWPLGTIDVAIPKDGRVNRERVEEGRRSLVQ